MAAGTIVLNGSGAVGGYVPPSAVTESPATHTWVLVSDDPDTGTTVWSTTV
jgi:hypothetical protein